VIVAHIFISYATPDRPVADEISSWLRAAGHEPFLDHDLRDGISVGEHWKQRLYRELREVDAVIGVVTSSFVASNWCAAEVGIADALGCRLMPVRAEAGVVHPLMRDLQHADYQADPQQALERVLQAVRLLGVGGGTWGRVKIPSQAWSRSLLSSVGCSLVALGRPARSAIGCAPWGAPVGCWPSLGRLVVENPRW
jgi:hypothetical protein